MVSLEQESKEQSCMIIRHLNIVSLEQESKEQSCINLWSFKKASFGDLNSSIELEEGAR